VKESPNKGIIYAIVFGSLVIAGALVFLGMQMKGSGMDDAALDIKIEEGINRFIEKQKGVQQRQQQDRQKVVNQKVKNVRRVSPGRDHIFGNPNAPISLIEYSDFECPFCKRFHGTAKQIIQNYKGKVNWVYRHFPLQFHNPQAQIKSEGVECANELGGNRMFWKLTDMLYLGNTPTGKNFTVEKMVAMAGKAGMDTKKFTACLQSGKYTARVKEDLNEGASIGITGTPGTVVLNNRTGEVVFKAGAYPFEAFQRDIDRMLR